LTASTPADHSGILVFCHPPRMGDFKMNFAALAHDEKLFFLTDGRRKGTSDTREAFYRHLRSGRPSSLLDADQIDDCIQRCRLLRNLDRRVSERRLHAMAAALQEWLDRLKPAAVICHMVDDYVTHLLSILAQRRDIRFVGYAYSFFPGRLQLTSYANGDAFDIRTPSAAEVEETIASLSKPSFRQEYGQRTDYPLRRHVLRVGRYYLKRIVFLVKGYLEHDPLHVHYAQTPYLAERRSLWNFPSKSCFDTDWVSKLAVLQKKSSFPTVYVPLGFFPEATIDYWIHDRSILDYENKMKEIVAAISRDCIVVVKEHPQMLGSRNIDFYRRLRSIPNVVLVPPLNYFDQVMENCDAVLLGAGSGGVEAALHAKPIFTFSRTSYWYATSGAFFLDLASIGTWAGLIVEALQSARPLSKSERYEFIKGCLRSTAFSRPGGRRWPLIDPQHLAMLLEVARKGPSRQMLSLE
jgi:hypothetical protein